MNAAARAVYLCDGVRTPFGRYRGGLSTVRTDDLAALPLRHLIQRHPALNAFIIVSSGRFNRFHMGRKKRTSRYERLRDSAYLPQTIGVQIRSALGQSANPIRPRPAPRATRAVSPSCDDVLRQPEAPQRSLAVRPRNVVASYGAYWLRPHVRH